MRKEVPRAPLTPFFMSILCEIEQYGIGEDKNAIIMHFILLLFIYCFVYKLRCKILCSFQDVLPKIVFDTTKHWIRRIMNNWIQIISAPKILNLIKIYRILRNLILCRFTHNNFDLSQNWMKLTLTTGKIDQATETWKWPWLQNNTVLKLRCTSANWMKSRMNGS